MGKELEVTQGYFLRAYRCVFEIGVKLAQVLWRKQLPDEIKAADGHLNNVAYELLREEKFHLAMTLLDFATQTLKKRSDEEQRRISVVNRAQAYKWIGKEEEAREIIESEDWSATSIEFRLAEAVLKDDFLTAAALMKKIGPEGYPSKAYYKDWPLFREFRKSDEFLKTYQEVFGEEFSISATEGKEVSGDIPKLPIDTPSLERATD